MFGGCCSWDGAGGRVTRGGRGSFLVFVRKQETATAAMASIEDAAECGERADALVSGVLGKVMTQRRSIAVALDYVKALSRGTWANCWELAEAAGHEGPHRMQALLRRYMWPWEKLRALLPAHATGTRPLFRRPHTMGGGLVTPIGRFGMAGSDIRREAGAMPQSARCSVDKDCGSLSKASSKLDCLDSVCSRHWCGVVLRGGLESEQLG
jgi:hypothetical protein